MGAQPLVGEVLEAHRAEPEGPRRVPQPPQYELRVPRGTSTCVPGTPFARSTYNEAARQSRSYPEKPAQRRRIFKNFQANAQRLQFFELGDCPLKRELDAMLEI